MSLAKGHNWVKQRYVNTWGHNVLKTTLCPCPLAKRGHNGKTATQHLQHPAKVPFCPLLGDIMADLRDITTHSRKTAVLALFSGDIMALI